MTDLNWLSLALTLLALSLPGSILFLATRIKGGIVVNVTPPTAVLPEALQQTLEAVQTKLTPYAPPATDEQVSHLVYEAVALADNSKLKGPDKFRIAKDFIEQRVKTLNVTVDPRDIALRVEAAVALSKKRV